MTKQNIVFDNPEFKNLGKYINASSVLVKEGRAKMAEHGKESGGVVIVSTGPSIEDPAVVEEIKEWHAKGYDLCVLKESLKFLREEHGLKAKYSVSMDPGGDRQVTRTPLYEDVIYCLASSCNPILYKHLESAERLVFHSACGYSIDEIQPGIVWQVSDKQTCFILQDMVLKTSDDCEFTPIALSKINEVQVYQELFPVADTMQGGFTVTNRSLALMNYFGYEDIVLAGTDFGWRDVEEKSHYASFVEVEPASKNYMTDEGRIDGTPWYTRPDQLASAVDIAKRVQLGDVKLTCGDTLISALAKKEREFLDGLIQMAA